MLLGLHLFVGTLELPNFRSVGVGVGVAAAAAAGGGGGGGVF